MSGDDTDDAADPAPVSDAPDGRAARAERRRTQRREAILTAAKSVFRDKGYHQASVHDIIDEARIARGTFYLYFSSKQELFGYLVDDFLTVVRGQVRRITLDVGADPPREQLRANFRRVVATVLEHEAVASVILRDPTSFDEESRGQINQFFTSVLQLIEDAMRVGQSLGLVGACDVHIVAVVALGGLRESLSRLLLTMGGSAEHRAREQAFANPELVADELLEFFLRGVTNPDA